MANIFQTQVTPNKPKILSEERIFVYVPNATTSSKGIASFNPDQFSVIGGDVSLLWPMDMLVEQLDDPLRQPSLVQLLGENDITLLTPRDQEFVHTGRTTQLVNPITGEALESDTAEVKMKRDVRDAISRPDLVQLDDTLDFEIDPLMQDVAGPDGQYNKYTLKRNNPLVTPSLVKLHNQDFSYTGSGKTGIADIRWPYAYNQTGSERTDGFGLQRIKGASVGHLAYDANGDLQVDIDKLKETLLPNMSDAPTYTGGDGFDYFGWVGPDGSALKDAQGRNRLSITKEAVGLSRVENKAFSDYTYNDFGTAMKTYFENEFDGKLDKATWDLLFDDWHDTTGSSAKGTPEKWFNNLEDEDESIKDAIRALQLFLGFYDTPEQLQISHPAAGQVYGSFALIASTGTMWAVRPIPNDAIVVRSAAELPTTATLNQVAIETSQWGDTPDKGWQWNGTTWVDYILATPHWEWYDTGEGNPSFLAYIETDPDTLQPNGTADVGSSGKWIQSDHVHPTDPSKLDVDIYKASNILVESVEPYDEDTSFKVDFWSADETTPEPTRNLHIPYVRTGLYMHNWQGSGGTFTAPTNDYIMWTGTEAQFLDEEGDLPDGLYYVDDGESLEPGTFVNKVQLNAQGVNVDPSSVEHIVITDESQDYQGLVLTMLNRTETVGGTAYQRRELVPMEFAHPTTIAGQNALVVAVPKTNGESLDTKVFTQDRLMTFRADGTPVETPYIRQNVLLTSDSSTETVLTANKMLKSSTDNQVVTFDTGTIANKPLTSTATGDVQVLTLPPNVLMATDANGGLTTSTIARTNIVTTGRTGTAVNLNGNQVVISGANNTITEYDTGATAEIPIVANGSGSIKTMAALTGNRMIMSNTVGTGFTVLPISGTNAGQYVGVNGTGTAMTLITPPGSLPVTRTNSGVAGTALTVNVGSDANNANVISFF